MTVVSEKMLNNAIGKNNLFAPRTSLMCTHYLGGFTAFDVIVDHNHFLANNMPTNVYLRPVGVEFSVMYKFKLHKLGLHYNDIVSVDIESKEVIKENKEKSVIGRALIGGLLFGPIGAIVGGLSGLGSKEVIVFEPDFIMSVTYKDVDTNRVALFACGAGKKSSLYNDARAVFGSKLHIC